MDKLNIFDVEIDCLTAKETMQRVMKYLETESASVVEILTLDMLVQEQDDTQWKEFLQKMDLVIPGDCEILKAAGGEDRTLLKEAENGSFLKMLFYYLHKNKKKVFLISPNEDILQRLVQDLQEYNSGIIIIGSGILPEDGSREETVINDINGVEADCVLSVLPSPRQEVFINKSQALLNTRLWIGCGNFLQLRSGNTSKSGRILRYFTKKIFQYRVGKEKKGQ